MSSLENKFSMDGPSGTACTPPYTTEWLQAANDVPWPLARSWVAINSGNMDGAEPAGNGVDVAIPKGTAIASNQRIDPLIYWAKDVPAYTGKQRARP